MTLVFSQEQARQARDAAGLSQRGAARKLGVVRQTLVNLESGASVPGGVVLGRMASLYGVGVDAFFVEAERDDGTLHHGGNARILTEAEIREAEASKGSRL